MLYFLWSLAAFIIVLSILITVHELGHFLAARCCGVAVERCSIGFGRTLWRYSDKHGTEYIIAAIPLGGYVKILDERVDTVTPDRYHETFNYRSVWQRSAIIAAGPICNFLFAIFLYWLVFLIGVPGYRPIIGDIEPTSIAAQANISPGMELISVEGTVTPDWDSVRLKLMEKIGSRELKLGISSFGSTHNKILNLRGLQVDHNKQDPIIALGIIPLGPHIEPVLTEVRPGSAAMIAGLKAGDKIVQVDAKPIDTWHCFVNKIRNNPGQYLQLSIERDGIVHNITLLPDSKVMQEGKVTGFAGVVPKIIPLPEVYKTLQQYGPLPALVKASDKTWHLMRLTVSMLVKLITGDVKLNNLSGPLSIAHGAGVSAEYGLIYYLMFLALISINVGIINLFPLPVLDGGHLLFLAIEKLKGDPVSYRVQDLFYRIGSILLVLLMGLAIFNDLARLFYLIA